MRILVLLLIFIVSCTHTERRSEKDHAIYFIDTFLNRGISFEEIKSVLKEPDEIEVSKVSEKIYRYEGKSTKLLKWNFGVNDEGMVEWIGYHPRSNSLLDRVEILPFTLKRYNCKKKTEPDERVPHVIDDFTFFECAEGRIRAYYNIHGEVEDIVISRHIK